MASAIKSEAEQISPNNFCRGCLSKDRKLKPLSGEYSKLYYSLLGSGMLYGSEERLICWECEAVLRRMRKFQNQILHVQATLLELYYNMNPSLQTLSNLSISTKDQYDLFYESVEETNCSVKVEDFKLEPKTSQHSDTDNDFDDKTNNLEEEFRSIESTSLNKQNKNTAKKESKEQNLKIKKQENKRNYNKKALKDSVKIENPIKELSHFKKKDYMEQCTVTDLKKKFGIAIKKFYSYFKEEVLELDQIKEYIAKLQQNPCGDRCVECRLYNHSDFLLLLCKNFEEIKSKSASTTCLLCKKDMTDLDNLHTHLKQQHCTFWKCIPCNMYCRYEYRFRHINNQHTKVFTCNKCVKDFTSKHHFFLHFKKLHDTFICHHCNKTFKSRFKMIKHQVMHDENICRVCNKVFKSRVNFIKHIRAHHPEIINKEVNLEAAYCVECNRQFKTVDLYKSHLSYSVKHNKRPKKSIPCPKCGKIFTKGIYMKNHLDRVHMPENAKYKCTICEKFLTNNYSLKLHYQYVHLKMPKDKNKICDICGQGFHTNRTLANHRRTHTGERPYSCEYCSATFTQRTPMVAHQLKCSLQRKLV